MQHCPCVGWQHVFSQITLLEEVYTWCPTRAGRTGSWQHLRWGSTINWHHSSINICILIHLLRVAAPMATGELPVLHPLFLGDPSPCFILDQQLRLCQGAAAHAPCGPTLTISFTPVTAWVTGEELILRRTSVTVSLVVLVTGIQIPRLRNNWFLQFFMKLIHQTPQELLSVLKTRSNSMLVSIQKQGNERSKRGHGSILSLFQCCPQRLATSATQIDPTKAERVLWQCTKKPVCYINVLTPKW